MDRTIVGPRSVLGGCEGRPTVGRQAHESELQPPVAWWVCMTITCLGTWSHGNGGVYCFPCFARCCGYFLPECSVVFCGWCTGANRPLAWNGYVRIYLGKHISFTSHSPHHTQLFHVFETFYMCTKPFSRPVCHVFSSFLTKHWMRFCSV